MEVHALVDGWVSDLPPLLKEVAPLAQLVHLYAHLQQRSEESEKMEDVVFSFSMKCRKTQAVRQKEDPELRNSYLLTHERNGVVHTAIDNLSSSTYSDSQRSIVPHAASNSVPRLKHHHL